MDPFTGLILLAGVFVAILAMVEALRKLRQFSVRVLRSLMARMRQVALWIVAMMSVLCLDFVPVGWAGTRAWFRSMRDWPFPDRLAVCAFLALLIACPIVWIEFGSRSAYVVAGFTIVSSVSWILLRYSPSGVGSGRPSGVLPFVSGNICPEDCNPVFDAHPQLQIHPNSGSGRDTPTKGSGGVGSDEKEVHVSEARRSVQALRRLLSKRRLSRADRDKCVRLIGKLAKALDCTKETAESMRAILKAFRARVVARKKLRQQLHVSIPRLEKWPLTSTAHVQTPATVPQELQSRYAAVDRLLDILESSSSSEEACLSSARELGEQRDFSETQLERLSVLYAAILDDAELTSDIVEAVGDALFQMEARLESSRFTAKRPR